MTGEKSHENNFELSLKRLEELVGTLEKGELTLEESLAAFQEGVALVRNCRQRLDVAEAQVALLLEETTVSKEESHEA